MLRFPVVDIIKQDLDRKMVFVAGPRQVGKTSIAKSLLTDAKGYLNWDIPNHRELILTQTLPSSKLWIFDEIHRYRKWRNYLKGIRGCVCEPGPPRSARLLKEPRGARRSQHLKRKPQRQ